MSNKIIAVTMGSGKSNYHINQPYIDYLIKAGFTPLGLFNLDMCTKELVETCQGLLLPGGVDIDPVYYGEDNEGSFGVIPEKDEFERNVLHMFAEAGKPVFSICRGFQLVFREKIKALEEAENNDGAILDNFYYFQHLNGHQTNDKNGARRDIKTHNVLLNKEKLYGEGPTNIFVREFVNSMHHQGVMTSESTVLQSNKSGEVEIRSKHGNMTVLAFTSFGVNTAGTKKKDKSIVIEAADVKFRNTVVRGVQWHPEELSDTSLLTNYFNNTKKAMAVGGN